MPHLVVIFTEGFSSKRFCDTTFDKEENDPFYTHPCQSWAESTKFYTPESIAIHMDKDLLDEMEKNIILKKYDNATIQAMYKAALDICSMETDQIAIGHPICQRR
ncbi:hypothetical protein RO3G_00071 [Rhizopus delemar RA 99-880]|uniref:Uncharacterized protein n=1 Tax=Rhizopus delemar (strain RA 99-880 / ATCC MYA-4621 / FGSC 9543 / NRRL 43880) TaxID=246409 RepID=I1BGN7_RHIO9|nr:hypothetical protein RO3G_00071 [Rhizopus delemar RA 99-880]|eukprot:EIE75367.1 hypothetical protein RO3G_00071 [Rhizopus delemar RA 99-880]